jgi:phage shock protein E
MPVTAMTVAAPATRLGLPASALAASKIATISQADLLMRLQRQDLIVIDVRSTAEYAAGHIAGAINIPHDQLANRASDLPRDRGLDIALYCRSGKRSAMAIQWLALQGYRRLFHVEGDFLAWQAAGQPIVTQTR